MCKVFLLSKSTSKFQLVPTVVVSHHQASHTAFCNDVKYASNVRVNGLMKRSMITFHSQAESISILSVLSVFIALAHEKFGSEGKSSALRLSRSL